MLKTFAALAVTLLALAGCGVGLGEDLGTLDDGQDELRYKVPASISLSADAVKVGDVLTISLFPGAYTDGRLFFTWGCTQNGANVSHGGTFELHEASSLGMADYSAFADHFDWRLAFGVDFTYWNHAPGLADCSVYAQFVDRRGQWNGIASAKFTAE